MRSMRSTRGSPTAATGPWRSLSRPTRRRRISTRSSKLRAPRCLSGVRSWLESLRASWRSGEVLFVHAGVNPQIELEAFLAVPWNIPLAQLDEDRHWAWVRWPFLQHRPRKGFGGFFVIHGHTPNDARRDPSHEDQIAGFRLNLDAGSGMTGAAKMPPRRRRCRRHGVLCRRRRPPRRIVHRPAVETASDAPRWPRRGRRASSLRP